MSERRKTHNGRDRSGHFKVRQVDVEDLQTEPRGAEYVRDDVRLGGAVEDIGLAGGQRAKELGRMIQNNREDVRRLSGGRGRQTGRRRAR